MYKRQEIRLPSELMEKGAAMKKRNIRLTDYPSAILMLFFAFLYFSLFAGGFLSIYNLTSILVQSVIPCILVLGVAIVVISGGWISP